MKKIGAAVTKEIMEKMYDDLEIGRAPLKQRVADLERRIEKLEALFAEK
jgi:hypothetical protein